MLPSEYQKPEEIPRYTRFNGYALDWSRRSHAVRFDFLLLAFVDVICVVMRRRDRRLFVCHSNRIHEFMCNCSDLIEAHNKSWGAI